jgi:hypothetical protein
MAASSVIHLRMWRNALMWKYDDLHILSTCWLKDSVSSLTIPRLLTLDMSGTSVNGANHLLYSPTCASADEYGFRLLGIHAQPVEVEPVVKSMNAVRQYWQGVFIFESHVCHQRMHTIDAKKPTRLLIGEVCKVNSIGPKTEPC